MERGRREVRLGTPAATSPGNKILPDEAKFFLPSYVLQWPNYGVAGWQANNTRLPWSAKFSY
jgi:hypothetical protein